MPFRSKGVDVSVVLGLIHWRFKLGRNEIGKSKNKARSRSSGFSNIFSHYVTFSEAFLKHS